LAKDGRYEFMVTTEAPKLAFARTTSGTDVTHIDDSDGSMGKSIVEMPRQRRRAIVSFYVVLSDSNLSAIQVQ